MFEYNTGKENIVLREYGRNIQNIIQHININPDKERRTENCTNLVELVKQIQPSLKEYTGEYKQKIWDDFFIISDFSLDVNNPFPIPEKEVLYTKPEKVKYHSNQIKFKHYGKNIDLLIEKIIHTEEAVSREESLIYLIRLMKTFYNSYNKELLEDEIVLNHIKILSQGKLSDDIDAAKEKNLLVNLTTVKEITQKRTPALGNDFSSQQPRRESSNNYNKKRFPKRRSK